MPSIVLSDTASRALRALGHPVHVAIVVLLSALERPYLVLDRWALVLDPDLLLSDRHRVLLTLPPPPVVTRNTTTAIGLSVSVSFRPLTAAARRSGWIEDLC